MKLSAVGASIGAPWPAPPPPPLSLATTCDDRHRLPPTRVHSYSYCPCAAPTTTAPATAPTAPTVPTPYIRVRVRVRVSNPNTRYQVRRAAPRPSLGGCARQRRDLPPAHAASHPPAAVLRARLATARPGAPRQLTCRDPLVSCVLARTQPASLRYLRTCIPTCLALGCFACSIASCLLLTHHLLLLTYLLTYLLTHSLTHAACLLTHALAEPGPARVARRRRRRACRGICRDRRRQHQHPPDGECRA